MDKNSTFDLKLWHLAEHILKKLITVCTRLCAKNFGKKIDPSKKITKIIGYPLHDYTPSPLSAITNPENVL